MKVQDFWGQTPLHVVAIHTAMVYTLDNAPANLLNRLTHVMALLLSKGADPGIRNLAGDSPKSVGNSLTQAALGSALAAVAGEFSLEPEVMDHDSAPGPSEAAGGSQSVPHPSSHELGDSATYADEEKVDDSPLENAQEGEYGELNAHEVLVDQDAGQQQLPSAEAEQDTPHGDGPEEAAPVDGATVVDGCLLYTSPSPRDRTRSRMPSSA